MAVMVVMRSNGNLIAPAICAGWEWRREWQGCF